VGSNPTIHPIIFNMEVNFSLMSDRRIRNLSSILRRIFFEEREA